MNREGSPAVSEPFSSSSLEARSRSVPSESSSSSGLPSGSISTSLGDRELRIDQGHPLAHGVAAGPTPSPPPVEEASVVPPPRVGARRLLEAMQAEFAELDERAAEIENRASEVAQRAHALQQRELDLQAVFEQRLASLEERETLLRLHEETFSQRLADLDERARALEQHSEQLEQMEAELAAERQDLREQLSAELQVEQQRLSDLQIELLDSAARLTSEQAEWQAVQKRIQDELAAQLQHERAELWESLTQEWQQRRATFDLERSAWDQARQDESSDLERLRLQYQAAIDGLEAELTVRRERSAAESASRQQMVAAEIAEQRDSWQQELSAQKAAWQREQVQADQRFRFHQEHLERTRHELEQQLQDSRLVRQQERQRLADESQQLQRRIAQVELYRSALEEVARSLDRERMSLSKLRRATEDAQFSDQQVLEQQRVAWEQERQRQLEDLQRQQDAVHRAAESLQTRHVRLDRLRLELEETHRSTLELRLSVEEAWAQLAHQLGNDDQARGRVEIARQSLSTFFQQQHAALLEQRQDIAEHQARFQQQRVDFDHERRMLLQWFHDRDEHLRLEEQRLRRESADAATHDAAWRLARQQWLEEKQQAEAVIRKLLVELGQEQRTAALADLIDGHGAIAISGVPSTHYAVRPEDLSLDGRD
jgi:hypothetical protein